MLPYTMDGCQKHASANTHLTSVVCNVHSKASSWSAALPLTGVTLLSSEVHLLAD